MDFKFLISFGIGLGCYLVALGLFTLWKRYRVKKDFENEKKLKDSNVIENEVNDDENSNDIK